MGKNFITAVSTLNLEEAWKPENMIQDAESDSSRVKTRGIRVMQETIPKTPDNGRIKAIIKAYSTRWGITSVTKIHKQNLEENKNTERYTAWIYCRNKYKIHCFASTNNNKIEIWCVIEYLTLCFEGTLSLE